MPKNIFSKDKKGISGIIVTLLMIVLSLVAAGAVWAVINNVLSSGTSQISSGTKCLDVSITATALVDSSIAGDGSAYELTLSRSAKGEVIGGEKIVLSNGISSSSVLDFGVALAPLETKKQTLSLASPNRITNVNKVEITPYFISASGNQELCPQTAKFEF